MSSSTKKRTAVKKQQPQQQQQPPSAPVAPLPSLPATPITSNPNPTATAKISAVDFRTFIQHAKSDDIEKFLELTSTTQDGQNLAFFWEQAYDRGYTKGRADVLREELDMASEQLQNGWMQCGWDVGYEEGYKKGKEDGHQEIDIETAHTATFKEGHILDAANKKWLWETVGHNINKLGCAQLKSPPMSSVGVQSHAPCMTTTVSSSTQMSPPPLVNIDMQTSVTMDPPSLVLLVSCLDWAEDMTSLPIASLLSTPLAPHRYAPRDFLGLCSSWPNPFGSLQHRSCTQIAPCRHQKISFTQPLPSCY